MNTNTTSETEINCQVTNTWVTEWTCPGCKKEMMTTIYGQHTCTCGARFEVRKQPYASKTPAYVVQLTPRQEQQPWPRYEVK